MLFGKQSGRKIDRHLSENEVNTVLKTVPETSTLTCKYTPPP